MTRALPLIVLLLAGCSPSFQTTSGEEYLAARDIAATDPGIRAAAAIEGDLRFPARIGLVRVVDGRIEGFSADETAALDRLSAQSAAVGTFQPISLILGSSLSGPSDAGPIDRARLVAARQHLDYLLVLSHRPGSNTTEAVFVDVRNGYPYATAQAGVSAPQLGNRPGEAAINRRTLALTQAILPQLEQMLTGLATLAARD